MGLFSFFKPKYKAAPSNVNNDLIKSTYTGAAEQGVGAQNVLAGALGVPGGDSAGAQAGFQQFSDNAGFGNVLEKLVQGITGGQAARGLLRSGSTGTRYLEEGTALNQQYYNNYLQNLTGLSGLGLGAGGLLTSAGSGESTKRKSDAATVGNILSGIGSLFSDRRLKEDIEKLDAFEDGLGIYRYRYVGQEVDRIGVMADEVAKLRPWALGPEVGGYATVNYGRL
jgi:hypothetical protein